MISFKIDASGLKRAADKVEKLANSIEVAEKKTNEEMPKKLQPYFEYASRQGITEWYEAYNPIYYGRTMSLLHVFEVQPETGLVNINLDSGRLGGHRVNGDYIYEHIFKDGFHGGAIGGPNHPSPGTPYWRTGIGFSHWGNPAVQTESAYDLMIQRIKEQEADVKALTWSTFLGYLKW